MKNSNNRTAGRLFFRSYNLLVELAFICGCFIFSACVFDRNWNPIPQTGDVLPSHVHASAAVTETWNDGLVHIEVVITGSGGEEELFRLTADRDFS